MNIETLRKMRNRAPFRPFQVHLTNGEILPVEYPDNMSLPQDEVEMFVLWTNDGWNLLEATQVAHVSTRRRTAK